MNYLPTSARHIQLARGEVDPTILIEKRFPLSDGVAAMESAAQRGAMKVLLE